MNDPADKSLDKLEEKPTILGPDANPVSSEPEKVAVIFAKLCEAHPSNAGFTIDEEKALPSLKDQKLVAVELPPNCLIADASTRLPEESKALLQLAQRAIAVSRSRGAVRLPVSEQLHWAKAFVVLFTRLNQGRIERIQLAAEFRALFEGHAKYLEAVKLDTVAREAAFVDGVREAYIAGALYAFSACEAPSVDESALEESVKIYLDSFAKDEPTPVTAVVSPDQPVAEEPNSVTKKADE